MWAVEPLRVGEKKRGREKNTKNLEEKNGKMKKNTKKTRIAPLRAGEKDRRNFFTLQIICPLLIVCASPCAPVRWRDRPGKGDTLALTPS